MIYKTVFLSICLCALVLGTPASNAAGDTACVSSTRNLVRACIVDTYEELEVTIANCKNFGDKQDQRACRRGAFKTQKEDRGHCLEQRDARLEVCDLLNERFYDPDPLLDSNLSFINPDEVGTTYAPNPYLNLAVGKTQVLRAGDDFEELLVIHVTEEVREIQGVDCRVVVDAGFEIEIDDDGDIEYVAVEVTDDWYAQDIDGNVYYCGELSRNFEDGLLTDLDGSFEAGKEYAKAGVLIQANPVVGFAHRQEFALDEAEDIVQYVSLAASPGDDEGGENVAFPCNGNCLKTFDLAPVDPESTEYKYYLPGTGFVLAVALEDGEISGEREELVCSGDSLAVLNDDSCGIEDPKELLEELCEVSPEAFCD